MSEKLFLYRVADTDDRDCCKYIEKEYGHDCIHEVVFCGACYCGRFGRMDTYEEVETVLSKKDFNLITGKDISKEDYERIVGILESEKGQAFFEKIVESEKEYLKDEFNLDDDDIKQIFDEYGLDYQDRGVVGYVFDDCKEVGREYFESCYRVESWLEKYIDYEKFGEDLCEDGTYVELSDGRVVSLNY